MNERLQQKTQRENLELHMKNAQLLERIAELERVLHDETEDVCAICDYKRGLEKCIADLEAEVERLGGELDEIKRRERRKGAYW